MPTILVTIIGIVIAAMGLILLIKPRAILRLMAFFREGKHIYITGVLRLLFGIIFLFSATQCRLVSVITVLGILFLLGGVLIFALSLEKIRSIIDWWGVRPLILLRLLGILVAALGGLVIYAA